MCRTPGHGKIFLLRRIRCSPFSPPSPHVKNIRLDGRCRTVVIVRSCKHIGMGFDNLLAVGHRHTQARFFNHIQIVFAVAHRHDLRTADAQQLPQLQQSAALACAFVNDLNIADAAGNKRHFRILPHDCHRFLPKPGFFRKLITTFSGASPRCAT